MVVVEDVGAERGPTCGSLAVALDQVANRPILHHVIDALNAAGIGEVIITSSEPVADELRQSLACGDRDATGGPRFITQDAPMTIADGVDLALSAVGEHPCVVHLAHGMLAEPLKPLVDTLRPDTPDATVVVHHGASADDRLSSDAQRTLHIAEIDGRAALGMAGVWLFARGALRRTGSAPWRTPSGVDVGAFSERIAEGQGRLNVSVSDHWRRYAGDPLDLLELNQIVLDRLEVEPRRANGNGNVIEGRVLIDPGTSIRSSVVVGPAVIGPGVHIEDAYIGPYTAIGANARIEGAEIERSIIAPGASITHVGGRLVASVVGRDARVFRDFSLPRALRLRVGARTEVALC